MTHELIFFAQMQALDALLEAWHEQRDVELLDPEAGIEL
jgi:hypothetical protein